MFSKEEISKSIKSWSKKIAVLNFVLCIAGIIFGFMQMQSYFNGFGWAIIIYSVLNLFFITMLTLVAYGFGELIDIESENLELMNILIKRGNESLSADELPKL